MSLSANISLSIVAKESNNGDLSKTLNTINKAVANSFTDGTAANQANKAFSDKRPLAASASETLDLAAGLTDAFGQSITFASVKAMAFIASETNQGAITIGGGSNAFASFMGSATDSLVLAPGGMIVLTAPDAGYAVTADTGDSIDVTNDDGVNAAEYDVVLIGVTA